MKSKAVFAWGRVEAGMEEGLPRGRKKLLRVKDLFIILITGMVLSSPGGSVVKKKISYQCRRLWLHSWMGKIPWKRKWQPTPVFLPGEFHGQRSLVGYSPWGGKESDIT